MRALWLVIVAAVALGALYLLERAGVDLSQRPLSFLLPGADHPGEEAAALIETPEGSAWDRELVQVMVWLEEGSIAQHPAEAVRLFSRLDSVPSAAADVPLNSPLRAPRVVLDLRLRTLDELIKAEKIDDARAIAAGDTGRATERSGGEPDLQSMILQYQALVARRLQLGLNDEALVAADEIWQMQIDLLGVAHPGLAALWQERQDTAKRAGATREDLAAAEERIGPRSPRMAMAWSERADIALAAGSPGLDDAVAGYEIASCSEGTCFLAPQYAARIAMVDPRRGTAFIKRFSARASAADRLQLDWISIFAQSAERGGSEGIAELRKAMAAHLQKVESRVRTAYDATQGSEVDKIEASLRERYAQRDALRMARLEIALAKKEQRIAADQRADRHHIADAFDAEAKQILDQLEVALRFYQDDLDRRAPPAFKVPPTPLKPQPPAIPRQPFPGVTTEAPEAVPPAQVPPRGAPSVAPQRKISAFADEIAVFYATTRSRAVNRATADDYRAAEQFYGATPAGRTEYGVTTVSVPKARERGQLPLPSALAGDIDLSTFELIYDPRRHVTVLRIAPLQRDAFFSDLRAGGTGASVLFVHGFNMTFTDAARRTAQLKIDLDLSGPALMYSWPSAGEIYSYRGDSAAMAGEIGAQRFMSFLNEVRATIGLQRITVIAHSMGSRLVADALTRLAETRPPPGDKLPAVVFAAADMDSNDFQNRVAKWAPAAGRITLYGSLWDQAMWASTAYNLGPRAGFSDTIAVAAGLESVDASGAEGEFIHHSYFADGLLSDLKSLVRLGLKPVQRCVLSPQERGRQRIWIFNQSRCRLRAFTTAVDLTLSSGSGGAADALRRVREQMPTAGALLRDLQDVEIALVSMAAQ